ncbi:hypothetical protein Ahy_A01g002270 isoform B [Arachis hypogaea]|uniref:Uncharacterized protein n=1 Tax=Arachis hypogaea TaxID=3818 RepID=A0A445EQX6_ARAHY|nr:hypothetical protein Ahy_A01g002270 isoform B [Arachis hypogaea]
MLRIGLKWVDEVITDAPYAITEEFLNHLFYEYNIDYVIPGDDPCLLPDGTDAYAAAKKAGRYKQIKRTEGVSNIDIVGRIMSLLKDQKACEDLNDTDAKPQEESKPKILKKARQLGDFLLVGIHSDETVREENGNSLKEEEEEEEEVGEKSMSVDLRSCSGHGYRQTQFLILRRIQLTIFFRLREV